MPRSAVTVEDVWHTSGMRGTGSNDIVATAVRVPPRHVVSVRDVYGGTTPGGALHDAATYRWPLVPLLALAAAMPALGTAEYILERFSERLGERVALNAGGTHKERPAAQMRLAQAAVRLDSARALTLSSATRIQLIVERGERVGRAERARARLAAGHVVLQSRRVIAPARRSQRRERPLHEHAVPARATSVNTLAGHVIFDYDVSTEMVGDIDRRAHGAPDGARLTSPSPLHPLRTATTADGRLTRDPGCGSTPPSPVRGARLPQ